MKLEQESPSWSEAELSELGEGLKAHIVAHESVKEKLRDRIHWATRASRRACIWVHAVEIESDGEFAVLDESDDVEAGSRPNSWLSDADISRA